jgi:hypothetical protein
MSGVEVAVVIPAAQAGAGDMPCRVSLLDGRLTLRKTMFSQCSVDLDALEGAIATLKAARDREAGGS